MNPRLKNAAGVAGLLLLLWPARMMPEEEPAAGEDWTVVTCDGNLFMDYETNRVIFFNNVRVENPRGSIDSDRLTVFFSPDGKTVEKTEGEGNVRIRMGLRSGRSERFIYYPAEKKAVLVGDAAVTVAGDSVRGGTIIFYLDRNEMDVEESPTLKYVPEEDYQVDFKIGR